MDAVATIVLLVIYGTLVLSSGGDTGTGPKSMSILPCESYEFSCKDRSNCIPDIQQCDGLVDCDDKSDESDDCVFFKCGDGNTISNRFLCDGFFDCADGSDESKEKANCTKFECANGKEISMNLLCDQIDDCNDKFRSDECNCEESFTCTNRKCIESYLKCDGIDDCGDNSDEILCSLFTCTNLKAVGEDLVCDGKDDCGDTSDECECQDTFKCKNGHCISSKLTDNGNDDCGDGTDEPIDPVTTPQGRSDISTMFEIEGSAYDITTGLTTNGNTFASTTQGKPNVTTPPLLMETTKYDITSSVTLNSNSSQISVFACVGGDTIPLSLVCDGTDDCNDGFRSDECDCYDTVKCKGGEDSDHYKCIPETEVCDGVDDCRDGFATDECECPWTFICNKSRSCIHKDLICDGQFDCDDHSDELFEFAGCEEEFTCDNDKQIKMQSFCDGVDDCGDCSDEIDCKMGDSEWETYDMYFCLNGSCIRDDKICDGVNDCNRGDDETDCDYDVTNTTTDVIEEEGDVIDEDEDVTKEPTTSPLTKAIYILTTTDGEFTPPNGGMTMMTSPMTFLVVVICKNIVFAILP